VAYFDLEARSVELLGYHDHVASTVAVSKSGKKASSTSADYTIYIWDLTKRQRELVLRGHSDDVECFTFVDDHVGISASRDWRAIVWNLDTGAILHVLDGHEKDVLSVVYNDGLIYTSGDDMTLRVWDLETGKLVKMWGPFENETDTCAIDTVRGRAVLGCDDGVIRVFDVTTGETLAEIEAHRSGIKKVATSPVSGDILSAAYDQKILIWDAGSFAQKVELDHKLTTWERSFNWTPDGKRLLAGTFDGTMLVWDAASGRFLDEVGERGTGNFCLNDISVNEDGELATVSDDGFVRLGRLTPTEDRWVSEVEPRSGRVRANAVTLDDACSMVVVGAHDQKLHIFEKTVDSLENEIEVHLGEGPINCVRVAHHSGYDGHVFVACYNGAIVRVDRAGAVLGTNRLHGEVAIKALRLHPTETIGASCGVDGSVLAWNFEGNLVHRMIGHMGIVDDLDIDPSGKMVTSVSRDFTMKVFSLDDGKMLHSVSLGRRSPKAVCFFDPQTVIVTNYWGQLLRVDLETEKTLWRSVGKNGISSIARCGDHVVASCYDGAAYLVRSDDLSVQNTLRGMTQQRLQPSALI
jgi:WD40 repeat protein